MAAVRQYVDAFNTGDPEGMAATCADPMQILDGMSPPVWQGPNASDDWYRDVLTEGEHLGASGYRITLDDPRHIDVKGENADVVVPGDHDVQRSGQAAHSNWLCLHAGALQAAGRLAPNRQGMGERQLKATGQAHPSSIRPPALVGEADRSGGAGRGIPWGVSGRCWACGCGARVLPDFGQAASYP